MKKLRQTEKALRRARHVIRFMRDYFHMQACLAGVKIPGEKRNWKQTYIEVSGVASAWCRKALKDTRRTKGARQ